MRIELVIWKDAHRTEGPIPKPYIDMEPLELYTVGFFIDETDETVAIAEEYYTEDERYRNVHVIPKVNIVRRSQYETADTSAPARDGLEVPYNTSMGAKAPPYGVVPRESEGEVSLL